ncbi:MAG: tetratricopeptide repeat protein [Candidatus Cloacimonetes bacterium]|nr:tetratricopeptide repeat protein [Candidatus Cloacimonadota bacterium]
MIILTYKRIFMIISISLMFAFFCLSNCFADNNINTDPPQNNDNVIETQENPVNKKSDSSLNYDKALKNNKARKLWLDGDYQSAEKDFRNNAIENPNEGLLRYNLGTALYKNQKYEDAQKEFELALNDSNFKQKDKVLHNLGNIAYQTGDYEKALDNYRKALKENPDNIEARKNFEMTRLLLQQQQQQQSSDNKENDNDDKEEEKQQQQQKQDKQNQDENQQQQQQQQQQELNPDKKQAEQLLNALEQKQEQAKKDNETEASGVKKGKYW